ncbi:hypothetical protein [Phenylobacterium sp.]|uniref:hypothetical protein n=1 Tax=Phenylobacterium sp. TaxID=1871053 RepID=UPI0025FDA24C|nr:hypothetical protein [Phenylobacterium sp.]MBX3483970.1 hypothetical protein [Phenylobacterium sp.]
MNRLKTFLIAGSLLGAAPLPALAQAWPAAVVAAAPRAAPTAAHDLAASRRDDAGARRADGLPPSHPNAGRVTLKLADETDEIPEVDLRPKDGWTNDEGWRAGPTRVGFKRRF